MFSDEILHQPGLDIDAADKIVTAHKTVAKLLSTAPQARRRQNTTGL
jgi:phosphoribosylcarboxyaminoimidazole (NCAIR) mutase